MRETIGPLTEREIIIEDLKTRLKDLRAKGHPTEPEIYLLQRALNLEKQVNTSAEKGLENGFSTGYAGRRVIDWQFQDGEWSGQLYNRGSGVMKKESRGKTAEEMLRELMPTK